MAGCRGKRQAAVAAGGRVVVTTTAAGARAQADAGGGVVGHKGLELGGSAGECGRREPAKAREQAARSAGGWTHACFLFVLCVCNVSCWCPVGLVEERATDPVSV